MPELYRDGIYSGSIIGVGFRRVCRCELCLHAWFRPWSLVMGKSGLIRYREHMAYG